MSNNIYPTIWSLGKPRGSMKDCNSYYQVTISPPGGKQITTSFSVTRYKTREAALKAADDYMMKKSAELGLTRNQIRYLDKDTIEVQLTQGIIMKTDAANIDAVQKHPLNVKTDKRFGNIKYRVLAQDKKKAFPFTDLIVEYKIVEYINKNTLDLRICNLKEFGSISKIKKPITAKKNEINNNDDKNTKNDDKNTKIDDKNIKNNNTKIDNTEVIDIDNMTQHTYFNIHIDDLPENIWLLGKPAGTVFKRKNEDNIWTARVNEKVKQHSKTFNIKNYNSDEEAKKDALKWQINVSYALNETKNLIRIVDKDTIDIKIGNKISRIDRIYLPLVQKIPIFAATSGNGGEYVVTYINGQNYKFHGLLAGFNFIDHIDGNTMNNTLKNLRLCDYSMNNSNRHCFSNNGVKFEKNNKSYVARIKIDKNEHVMYFHINEHGENEAKKLATNARKKMAHCTKCENNIKQDDEPQLMRIELLKITKIINLFHEHIVLDYKKYLPENIDLQDDEIKKMHKYYLDHQLTCLNWYRKEKIKIIKWLNNKKDNQKIFSKAQ